MKTSNFNARQLEERIEFLENRIDEISKTEVNCWLEALQDSSWGVAVFGPVNYTCLSSNPALSKMTEYSLDELDNISLLDLFSKGERNEVRAQLNKIFTNGHDSFESVFERKDGTTFPAQINAVSIKNTLDKPQYKLIYIQDLTQQKQIEDELKQSVALHRSFFESDIVGILCLDMGRIDTTLPRDYQIDYIFHNAKVRLANDSFAKYYGFEKKEDVLGKPLSYLWNDDYEMGKEVIGDFMDVGYVSSMLESYEVDKDGNEIWLENTSSPQFDGKYLEILWITLLDITKRKVAEKKTRRLEERLNQTEKMEAIGSLASGIAHDFNNVLSIILGYLELSIVKLDDPEITKNDLMGDLNEVLDATHRAGDLAAQILTFARKDEKGLSPINLSTYVKESTKFLRTATPTGISVNYSLESDPIIESKPTQIHQILINLGTNASHAMGGNSGAIEFQVTEESIGDEDLIDDALYGDIKKGEYAVLTVKDNGSGIDVETQKRMFEPYFTTKPEGAGTGIGLAQVYNIVADHQGGIRCISEVGVGTKMKLYFPISKLEEIPPAEVKAEKIADGTEKIMVVDDEEKIAMMLKERLKILGYHVDAFSDPVEALDKVENGAYYDLIITDTNMPGMRGDKLIEKIKLIRPNIGTIICTGHSDAIDADTAKEKGIDEFLAKPLEGKVLASTVRNVLDK